MKWYVSTALAVCLLHAPKAFGQHKADTLFLVDDPVTGESGYVNAHGDTVIATGKYVHCFTDTFTNMAIVISEDGLVGINQQEKVLFHVYMFDNGPDYPADGLFRIVENGKIGFANLNGDIVIAPQYDCAYPFENGVARVGVGCKTENDGEHQRWVGGDWITIDTSGKKLTD